MVAGPAYATCERLARAHYENFPVASRLLPKSARKHVAAIYAFARLADDFADEGDRTDEARLELVRWHLDHTPPERVDAVALGGTVLASRDELLVALVSRAMAVTDDVALREAIAPLLAGHHKAMPGLVDDLVSASARLADDGVELETVERFLDRLARTGDPAASLTHDGTDDPEFSGSR